jgi:hypothetical protein
MYFVPEGQHDSSQARSAWSHEENSPVPAGRLNGSRHRLDANITFQQGYLAFPSGTSIRRAVARSCRDSVSRTNISGTDNDFGHPSGTELSASLPGTSCLAYSQLPLRDKKPSAQSGLAGHQSATFGVSTPKASARSIKWSCSCSMIFRRTSPSANSPMASAWRIRC